jgi:hypothetical protein
LLVFVAAAALACMPDLPLNLVALERPLLPSDTVIAVGQLLGGLGGWQIGDDTFLVPADFDSLVMALYGVPGMRPNRLKVYSLSAFQGGMERGQLAIRELARAHWRHEQACAARADTPNPPEESPDRG